MAAEDGSCQFRARQSHTAHLPQVELTYPFHPLHGRRFRLERRYELGGDIQYMVVLPDGTRSFVPRWMTEPAARLHTVVDNPALCLRALLDLRRLLDAARADNHDGAGGHREEKRATTGSVSATNIPPGTAASPDQGGRGGTHRRSNRGSMASEERDPRGSAAGAR